MSAPPTWFARKPQSITPYALLKIGMAVAERFVETCQSVPLWYGTTQAALPHADHLTGAKSPRFTYTFF